MNNYEKIKQMSMDEVAELLAQYHGGDIWCDKCIEDHNDGCYGYNAEIPHCYEYIKEWLESESEE